MDAITNGLVGLVYHCETRWVTVTTKRVEGVAVEVTEVGILAWVNCANAVDKFAERVVLKRVVAVVFLNKNANKIHNEERCMVAFSGVCNKNGRSWVMVEIKNKSKVVLSWVAAHCGDFGTISSPLVGMVVFAVVAKKRLSPWYVIPGWSGSLWVLKKDVMDIMVVKVVANKSAGWVVRVLLEVGEVASPSLLVVMILLRINAMRLVRP